MKKTETVLTIAGSDSSGGAGIQADLKTFAAHGLFGRSVIASITAQNTSGVHDTFDLPEQVVEQQVRAVFGDGVPAAVKTGMLGNEVLVDCVARMLKRYRVKNLVVDPVIRSSSGKSLLSAKGIEALKNKLLPLAKIVTPNLREAEILSGIRIKKPADRIRAAKAILKTGVKSVLITGGHLKGDPEDFFYDGRKTVLLESKRLSKEDLHGTGCVLSAAIASGLAGGMNIADAVASAKTFIGTAILGGVRCGQGAPCVEPLSSLLQGRERMDLLRRVAIAEEIFKRERIGNLIPEVQSNIGVGLEHASNIDDVIGFPGRIVKVGDDIAIPAPPAFGASKHVARIVLTVMRHDPEKRAVMNIKFTEELLNICERLKFKIASFDRADEPKKIREIEGSSLEWGTENALSRYGKVPDIIYDRGGMRKEEMIRVIAGSIEDLVEKVLKIHRAYLKASR